MTGLTDHIKQSRAQGNPDEKIRQDLTNKGYSDEEVTKAISASNRKGKIAMIWGIVALVLSAPLGIILGTVSLFYGIKALRHNEGREMGIAGVILGILSVLINIGVIIVGVTLFIAFSTFSDAVEDQNMNFNARTEGVKSIESGDLSLQERTLMDTADTNEKLTLSTDSHYTLGGQEMMTYLIRNTGMETGCFYSQFTCEKANGSAKSCDTQHPRVQTTHAWFNEPGPIRLEPDEAKVVTVSYSAEEPGVFQQSLNVWAHQGACDKRLSYSDVTPDNAVGTERYSTNAGTNVTLYASTNFTLERR